MTVFYAEKFRNLRKSKKVTLNAFAELTGFSRRTLWVWETGQRVPSEKKIRIIAKHLGVPLMEISDLENEFPKSETPFPKFEQYWESLVDQDIKKQDEKFLDLLYSINQFRNDLKQSTVLLQALLSSMKVMFYIKNHECKYVLANTSFLQNVSMSHKIVVLGKSDEFFFPKSEAAFNFEQDEIVIKTGKAITGNERYIPGSRKKKWGLISKLPIFDPKGKISGLIGTFIDITERKTAEDFHKLLKSNMDYISDGVAVFDCYYNECLYMNKSFGNQYDMSLDNFNKEGFERLVSILHPSDLERIKTYITSGDWPEKTEFSVILSDDEVRCFQSLHKTSVYQGKNCISIINKDITREL